VPDRGADERDELPPLAAIVAALRDGSGGAAALESQPGAWSN
jgi:hypothetical protein